MASLDFPRSLLTDKLADPDIKAALAYCEKQIENPAKTHAKPMLSQAAALTGNDLSSWAAEADIALVRGS